MTATFLTQFRGELVEIRYEPRGHDDVMWEFRQEAMNYMKLTARERQELRLEALAESRR